MKKAQLAEDKRYNNLLPSELYRFILNLEKKFTDELQQVKNDLQVAQERIAVLEADKIRTLEVAEKEEILKHEKGDFLNFTHFSSTTLVWDPFSLKLSYNGGGHNYAISNTPLDMSRTSTWTVDIEAVGDWILFGIIGSFTGVSASSYSHATCFAWASSSQVWINGKCVNGNDGWNLSFLVGDHIVFTFNPSEKTLSMYLTRSNTTYAIKTTAMTEAYVHCNVHKSATVVKFSKVEYL
jgi:hypothetical protein